MVKRLITINSRQNVKKKLKREQRKLSRRALLAKQKVSICLKLEIIKNKKRKIAYDYMKSNESTQ